MEKKKSLRNTKAMCLIANRFGSKFAEASCLGEHEVAVSSKKEFISRRFYISPSRPYLF